MRMGYYLPKLPASDKSAGGSIHSHNLLRGVFISALQDVPS